MEYIPILKSLSTMAVLILAGWLSRRLRVLASEDTKVLSGFVYHFSLPALFFAEVIRIDFKSIGLTFLLLSLLPVVIITIGLMVLRFTRAFSKDTFVLVGLSALFGSHAFFGVPFFESLYGAWGLNVSVVTASVLSIYGIVASIALFEYAVAGHKGFSTIYRILRSPLVLSLVIGGILNFFKPHSGMLAELVLPLGKTAPGTAIFVLGMFVHDRFSPALAVKVLPLVLVRNILLSVLALVVLSIVPIADTGIKRFLLLQSGIPAAISIAIFAERYDYKVEELTGVVVVTSLLSFVMLGGLYSLSFWF
jgi:predicted permease